MHYESFRLARGGGIYQEHYEPLTVPNNGALVIGIGGAGIECLRCVEAQVLDRIQPDDRTGGISRYQKIRFLGIDADPDCLQEDMTAQRMEMEEQVLLYNRHLRDILRNEQTFDGSPAMAWSSLGDGNVELAGDPNRSGIRQIGRFLLMHRAWELTSRLREMIRVLREEIHIGELDVHVITGLCGGTGSGCFLDVCYLLRHVLDSFHIQYNLFGHFFLPDVMLSKVPMLDSHSRAYLVENGYAALQELDHCMRLEENGCGFTQAYPDNIRVPWKKAPVDYCNLVSDCTVREQGTQEAYRYAMESTAEHILMMLIFGSWTVRSQLAPAFQMALAAEEQGYCRGYYSANVNSFSIPHREIETYLASSLITQFAEIRDRAPERTEVEKFAVSALSRGAGSCRELYESLFRELLENVHAGFDDYTEDWRFVLDGGAQYMHAFYRKQTDEKLCRAEENARRMLAPGDPSSLICRLDGRLQALIQDLRYGPMYGYRLLGGHGAYSLMDILHGLLQESDHRRQQAGMQAEMLQREYEQAKADFETRRRRKLFDTDANRFEDYRYRLTCLEQETLRFRCHTKLQEVLLQLHRQAEKLAERYSWLCGVCDDLLALSRENLDELSGVRTAQDKISGWVPLTTVSEIRGELDRLIEQVRVPAVFAGFVQMLLENEVRWEERGEAVLKQEVSRFFADDIFGPVSNITITGLAQKLLGAQWTQNFEEWFLHRIHGGYPQGTAPWNTDRACVVHLPNTLSAYLMQAYQLPVQFQFLPGAGERICCTQILCPVGLWQHVDAAKWMAVGSQRQEAGRYSYEKPDLPDMPLSDWRQLSPLIPDP